MTMDGWMMPVENVELGNTNSLTKTQYTFTALTMSTYDLSVSAPLSGHNVDVPP